MTERDQTNTSHAEARGDDAASGVADGGAESSESLRAEVAAANNRALRALADFQNLQRRQYANVEQARREGAVGVLRAILPVLDQFDLAAAQAVTPDNAEQIARGVAMIRQQLIMAVQASGVEQIAPSVGDAFDASRHEAVVHQPAEGVAPGCVSAVLRAGYAISGVVVRPAQVAVAPVLA